jgi:hypothetical protein
MKCIEIVAQVGHEPSLSFAYVFLIATRDSLGWHSLHDWKRRAVRLILVIMGIMGEFRLLFISVYMKRS